MASTQHGAYCQQAGLLPAAESVSWLQACVGYGVAAVQLLPVPQAVFA